MKTSGLSAASFRIGVAALLSTLTACSQLTPVTPASSTISSIATERTSPQSCQTRSNDTPEKLSTCMDQASLWYRMEHFQRIANENPDTAGHGNCDTGTPGYKASVTYVAGLMRQAGYKVTVQPYIYAVAVPRGDSEFRTATKRYSFDREWFVARGSAAGAVTAPLERSAGNGCTLRDFAGFTPGDIAVLARGACSFEVQITNAQAAGARAAILYRTDGYLSNVRLTDPAAIPVIGINDAAVAKPLTAELRLRPVAHVDVRMQQNAGTDYNVIADSPYGDPQHVLAVDAHLDSIYGAGMLDNASGSSAILEIALNLAKTKTFNKIRYIWFGGEELGLLGSRYYTTKALTKTQLKAINFDVDVDVAATPNFVIYIADPTYALNAHHFPPNVVPGSAVGNTTFFDYFNSIGVVAKSAPFGNSGTDSNAFSLAGVPNSGILTQQDCCKERWETALWGGFLGDYEGAVPGVGGGCVDRPNRWCDNLSNNSPFVLGMVARAVAVVVLKLADNKAIRR